MKQIDDIGARHSPSSFVDSHIHRNRCGVKRGYFVLQVVHGPVFRMAVMNGFGLKGRELWRNVESLICICRYSSNKWTCIVPFIVETKLKFSKLILY